MRSQVNEHELSYNNKKKAFKYEIQLDQEKQYLDYIEQEGDPGAIDLSAIGISQNLINPDTDIVFGTDSRGPQSRKGSQKEGWLATDAYYKKTSKHMPQKGPQKDEFDFTNYTRKQLQKNKE